MPQLVGTTPPPARTGPADCCQSRNLSSSVVPNVGSPDPRPPCSEVWPARHRSPLVANATRRDAPSRASPSEPPSARPDGTAKPRRSVLSRLLMFAPRRKAARRRYLDRDQEDRSLAQRLRGSPRPGCCSASTARPALGRARACRACARHRLGVAWLLSPAARPVRHDGVQARRQRDRRGYRRRARCENCRAGAGDRRGRVVFAATAGFEA